MKIPREGWLLRIFVGASDRHDGRSVYEAIVLRAREMKLAGATVLKGVMGFGAHSRLHAARVMALSDDLPVVIEIVDAREKLEALLPYIEEVVQEGLVTLERVEVIVYRPGAGPKGNAKRQAP